MEGTSTGTRPTLSTADLAAQITEVAGHLNAANRRWLALIADFDRRKGWVDSVTQSCAHWLNWQCGINLGAAREKVRVAHALEKLPLIGAAMARGELSYAKVRALTRVACGATETTFLSIALHGTAHHVETIVRQYRRATEAAELSREVQQQAGRSITCHWDDDGSLVLKARLPAEAGTLLLRALEAAEADAPLPDVSAETRNDTPRTARRADALCVLAESFLKHGAEALAGGERQQIVVHVDYATLRQRASGRCELDAGPAIPVARDQGCRFPGCTQTRYVDGHHIHHWADGGETKLANLVSLCRFHHRQVHEGGRVVERLDDGAWRLVKPSGDAFVSSAHCAEGCDGTELMAAHRAQGLAIDARTAATRWRGERMDYVYALDVLVQRASAPRRDVSAETGSLEVER